MGSVDDLKHFHAKKASARGARINGPDARGASVIGAKLKGASAI